MSKFQLRFHWILFQRVQLTIFQHWMAPSHYLNQWWLVYWRKCVPLGLNELNLVIPCGMLVLYIFSYWIRPLQWHHMSAMASLVIVIQWLPLTKGQSRGQHSHDMTSSWFTQHDFNTLRPRQNGRRFTDDTFKCIFLNENVRISIKISLKFVPRGPINNIPALVQIMAWCRSGNKPFSEPMMVSYSASMSYVETENGPFYFILTHPPLCRMYVSVNWAIIGSGNGLSPIQRQAITWTKLT